MAELSILICSIEERMASLSKLLCLLDEQKTNDVEILVEVDNKQKTTGTKRNILLERASGEYIAFIDDDDLISGDYVDKILKAICTRPDCCGIEGLITFQSRKIVRKFIHSIKYNKWFENGGIYYRNPNHLSPVRRYLALKAKFPSITVGEDHEYSRRLFPFLKSEVYIHGPIYYYLTE